MIDWYNINIVKMFIYWQFKWFIFLWNKCAKKLTLSVFITLLKILSLINTLDIIIFKNLRTFIGKKLNRKLLDLILYIISK